MKSSSLWSLVCFASLQSMAMAQLPTIALEPVSQGDIVTPVAIANAGDGSNRLFVADQRGKIHVMENGNVLATPFLDLSSKLVPERPNFDERGLLGLAFHPNFGVDGATNNDKFYVYYSGPRPGGDPNDPVNPINHQSVIAEYSVTGPGSNLADLGSERVLLTFDQPQFNHNGGWIGFGPDNMLYITTGDGGAAGDNDPGHTGGGPGDPSGGLGNAQDLSKFLGKVLRIDVDDTAAGPYGVPADNPFVARAGALPEIYAYGLRNPWRASFDRETGRLVVADVGQGDVEEINIVTSGGNYGWRIKEGTFDFDSSVVPANTDPLIDPIAQYAHPGSGNGLPEIGLSVTGGVVYRGTEFPDLRGTYIFGDWSTGFGQPNGTMLGLQETSPGVFDLSVLNVVGGNPIGEFILAFGEDENGEIYVATKLQPAPSGVDPTSGMPTGSIYHVTAIPEPSTAVLLLLAGMMGWGLPLPRRARWGDR